MVSFVRIEGRIVRGFFQKRLNRFLALAKIEERVLPSFLPNPGRMYELLIPGTEVVLREVLDEKRKTGYDLIGVLYEDQIVSVDSRVPNRLVLEALKNGDIKEVLDYPIVKPEYKFGHSRFDFFLANEKEKCLLEVKSCTLVKDGVAKFPDAKTDRGRRHLIELIKAKKEAFRALVLFVIQRSDAKVFVPNDETDPEFGKALRVSALEGVEVYAYYSEFAENKIIFKKKVKVEL